MSLKTVNLHQQRAITIESLKRYGPLSNVDRDIRTYGQTGVTLNAPVIFMAGA